MDTRYDSKLYEYFKTCQSFDNKSKTIDRSELACICSEFRLNLRDCTECIKIDSQGRISYTELMRYIQNYAYHKGIQNSPPNLHPYPQELPTIYRTYTDESFTPDYRSDEGYINYSSSRIPHQEHNPCISPSDQEHDTTHRSKPPDTHHWGHHHSSRESPSVANGGDTWHQEDYINNKSGRPNYCRYCKHWQKQAHSFQEELVSLKRENEKLQLYFEKMAKDFQQSSDYYQKHLQKHSKDFEGHIASVERDRLKLQSQMEKLQRDLQQTTDYNQKLQRDKDKLSKELKRLREEADSDGSRSYYERYYDNMKRSKEEIEFLKQYKKHYQITQQENDQLKQQLHDLQKEKWLLKDEISHLQCEMFRDDPLLSKHKDTHQPTRYSSGSRLQPSVSRASSPEQEPSNVLKGKSVKSAPSEASDIMKHISSVPPADYSNIVTILDEDVNISVLPESLSQDQQQQIVYALQNCHSIEELIRCLVSYGVSTPHTSLDVLQVDNELLNRRVKHLEAKYHTLTTSFELAKEESDAMYLKLGRVEGNNYRLRQIVKLCQHACEVHELLYEMKTCSTTSTGFSSTCDSDYASRNTDQTSSRLELGKYVQRARSLLHDLESNKDLQTQIMSSQSHQGDGKFSLSGWNLSMSQYTGTTSGLSSAASSMGDIELNRTEIDQLKSCYQGLIWHSNQLIEKLIEIDGIKGLDTVKESVATKDSVHVDSNRVHHNIADMEDCVDTEELCKMREEKAELRSQLYMMEQSKRSMELQVSQIRSHKNMLEKSNAELQALYKLEKEKRRKLRDKIKLLKAENHILDNSGDMQYAQEREKEAIHRYEELYMFLQKHVQDSQEINEQLVEFVKELLRANRALVEAFERAKKRQQFEKRQLKQEIIQLNNRIHNIHMPIDLMKS